jgi:tetratricopeptide (TPR) repeat protein
MQAADLKRTLLWLSVIVAPWINYAVCNAQDPAEEAAILFREAQSAFSKEHYAIAEAKAYKAADLYLGEAQLYSYAEALLLAVDCHWENGQKEVCKKGYRTVVDLCVEHRFKHSRVWSESMLKLAKLYFLSGDSVNADDILQKSLLRAERYLPQDHPLLQWAYGYTHDRLLSQGKAEEATRMRHKRLTISVKN